MQHSQPPFIFRFFQLAFLTFFLLLYLFSAWELISPSKLQPSIFSVHPGTEKPNKTPHSRQKALIIPVCCTSLKQHLHKNSLQTLNKSCLRYSSDLTEPKCHKTKHYCNWLLNHSSPRSAIKIEPSKSYFILQSVLTRNIVRLSKQISIAGTLYTLPPRRHSFFFFLLLILPFQNLLLTKSSSPRQKGS